MAPHVGEEHFFENNIIAEEKLEKLVSPQASPYKQRYRYDMIIAFLYYHVAAVYGLTYLQSAKWSTLIFMYVYFVAGIMGITVGAHRLWSHNAFKANMPLHFLLMLCHSSINQFSAIWWVKIHRQHHKYSDTDGDPMNASRGVFYSHIGWLLTNRHPECLKRKKFVDVTDVKNNPVLKFQKKHGIWFIPLIAFIVPSVVPLLWGETFGTSYHINMLRVILSYHILFTINSIAHTWGNKPFDKNVRAAQTDLLHFVAFGDGYHNFHHAFPWDYRSGEWGGNWGFSTAFIDFFAKIGWATDLKTVPQDVIAARAKRTGDGSKTVKLVE